MELDQGASNLGIQLHCSECILFLMESLGKLPVMIQEKEYRNTDIVSYQQQMIEMVDYMIEHDIGNKERNYLMKNRCQTRNCNGYMNNGV